jgi:uncharacterized protein YkwD
MKMTKFATRKFIKTPSIQWQWLFPSLMVCAAALTGCGGGGGGTSESTPLPVAPVVPTISPTTNPTPTACSLTIQTGGIATGAMTQLNQYRSEAFLGASLSPALLLDSDPNLVTAAGNHANYLSLLVPPDSTTDPRNHDELATNPCFTGTKVSARIAAAGNTDKVVGENFSETSIASAVVSADPTLATNAGASILDGLFSAVYHRMSLLSNFTHAGIAWQSSSIANLPPTILAIDLSQHQMNTYSNLITYPYSGQMGVMLDWLVDESPCPLGCNNTGALAGLPITIQTDGRALVISSFTVTSPSGNVAGKVLTATAGSTYLADPNLIDENAYDRAAFVPLAPLTANTNYTVTVSGTTGGVQFTKSWIFTTLANTPLQLASSASTVSVGRTFDITLSQGSQNYHSNHPLSYSAINGPGASSISLSSVQLASNRYRFTYNGQCTISTGCPVTFTGLDTVGNTATTLVTVMP